MIPIEAKIRRALYRTYIEYRLSIDNKTWMAHHRLRSLKYYFFSREVIKN